MSACFETAGTEGLYDRRLGKVSARRVPVDRLMEVLASGAFVHCVFFSRQRPDVIDILPWCKLGDKPFADIRPARRSGSGWNAAFRSAGRENPWRSRDRWRRELPKTSRS